MIIGYRRIWRQFTWQGSEFDTLVGENNAGVENYALVNKNIVVNSFDDTIVEKVKQSLRTPVRMDLIGSVKFQIIWFPRVFVAGSSVQFNLEESMIKNNTNIDTAYVSHLTGNIAVTGAQDQYNYFDQEIPIGVLGWEQDQQVELKFSRAAIAVTIPAAVSLVADALVRRFTILIPENSY